MSLNMNENNTNSNVQPGQDGLQRMKDASISTSSLNPGSFAFSYMPTSHQSSGPQLPTSLTMSAGYFRPADHQPEQSSVRIEEVPQSLELYFSNLPANSTDTELESFLRYTLKARMAKSGVNKATWVSRDPIAFCKKKEQTGTEAVVRFLTVDDCALAMSLNGVSLRNCPLVVTADPPPPPKPVIATAPGAAAAACSELAGLLGTMIMTTANPAITENQTLASAGPHKKKKQAGTGLHGSASAVFSRSDDVPSRQVRVTGFPAGTTCEHLTAMFNAAFVMIGATIWSRSPVQRCSITDTSDRQRYAIVDFRTAEDCTRALSLDGKTVGGITMSIRLNVPAARNLPTESGGRDSARVRTPWIPSHVDLQSPHSVFIGPLSADVGFSKLLTVLTRCGNVLALRLNRAGEPAHAFCQFQNPQAVSLACTRLNGSYGTLFRGGRLVVCRVQQLAPHIQPAGRPRQLTPPGADLLAPGPSSVLAVKLDKAQSAFVPNFVQGVAAEETIGLGQMFVCFSSHEDAARAAASGILPGAVLCSSEEYATMRRQQSRNSNRSGWDSAGGPCCRLGSEMAEAALRLGPEFFGVESQVLQAQQQPMEDEASPVMQGNGNCRHQ